MEVLMWLSHSEKSLKASDICHALGVEIGSTDPNFRNIPAIEIVLGCSLGLVTIEASTYTIRLVHYILKEYLSNNTDLFHRPHSTIAQVCLTFLNFQCIKDLSPSLARAPITTPFLEYASLYWGKHARREITESVSTLALRLLNGFDNHISSSILLSGEWGSCSWMLCRNNPTGFTGLHIIAYLGIVEIPAALLKMKRWNLNAIDAGGNTAILCAVRKGHEAMVKMLLERGDIALNTADRDGRTPLSWAAESGHEGIVNILLEREDVTPNTADKNSRTPLAWAAARRHKGVVKMLLEREDVTPNTVSKHGGTPLLSAAIEGDEDMVRMFLERGGVAPDIANEHGRTPLSWAAGQGCEGVVKILLELEDVTSNTTDKHG